MKYKIKFSWSTKLYSPHWLKISWRQHILDKIKMLQLFTYATINLKSLHNIWPIQSITCLNIVYYFQMRAFLATNPIRKKNRHRHTKHKIINPDYDQTARIVWVRTSALRMDQNLLGVYVCARFSLIIFQTIAHRT